MALPYKGTFTLATTDSGDKAITGVGGQGKALLMWCGRASANATWSAHAAMSIGMVDADGDYAGITNFDEDVLTASNTAKGRNTTFLLKGFSDGTPTQDFLLTFVSWDADGFTINVSDAPSQNIIVHFLVLDATDVELMTWNTVLTAGYPLDVTVAAGFGQPDLLIFMGAPANGGVLGEDTDANLTFGVAKSNTERFSCAYHHNDNETTMDCGSMFEARALMIMRDTTGPVIEQALDLDVKANWPVDGFRLNFISGAGTHTGYTIFTLALKGVTSKVGVASSPTTSGNQDLDATFVPAATFFATDNLPPHTGVDAAHADGHGLGFGSFDGTRQGMSNFQQDDASGTSIAKNISDTGTVIRLTAPGNPPVNRGTAVASYPSGNTVRLAWTSPTATARQFGWAAIQAIAAGSGVAYTDANTAYLLLTASGIEVRERVDAATVRLTLTPSAVEVRERVDAATAYLDLSASATEAREVSDVATARVALTPSATESRELADAETAYLTLTPAGIEDYTPGVAEQIIRPNGDVTANNWTTAPLFSKINDASDATGIIGVAA